MEVGIVKSFGRTSNGQPVSYAWIKRQATLTEYLKKDLTDSQTTSLSDIKVHRTQLNCSEEEIQKGVFVVFEVRVNPENDKQEACNVDLLKEIGIVKWFGGYDSKKSKENDFGFIDQFPYSTTNDIYIHKSQVNGLENQLKQGVVVTFYRRRNFRNNKDEAFDVKLLSSQDEIIKHYLNIPDCRLWKNKVVKEYLCQLPENLAIPLVTESIKSFHQVLKESIISELPTSLKNSIQAELIRTISSPKKRLDCYIKLLTKKTSNNVDLQKELLDSLHEWCKEELKNCRNYKKNTLRNIFFSSTNYFIKDFSNCLTKLLDNNLVSLTKALELSTNVIDGLTNTQREDFVTCLPKSILYNLEAQTIRNSLSTSKHFDVCIQILNETENYLEIAELQTEVLTTAIELSKTEQQELHWKKVPKAWYLDNLAIYQYLPLDLRIICIVKLFSQAEETHIKEKCLDQLAQCIRNYSEIDCNNIPLPILFLDKIWDSLPTKTSADVLLKAIKRNAFYTSKTIERLLRVLNAPNDTLWSDIHRTEFIKQLPNLIKREKLIFSLLPFDEQVIVLVKQWQTTNRFDENIIYQLSKILSKVNSEELTDLLKHIPNSAKQHHLLIRFLKPVEQVELIWSSLVRESISEWNKLSWQAKILCIYRAAEQSIRIFILEKDREEHLLVKAALSLLKAKNNPNLHNRAFEEFHKLFQDYVIQEAWKSTKPLELTLFLPPCSNDDARVMHLKYCEATPWDKHKNGESKPYCPRLGHSICSFECLQPQEAKPHLKREWKYWCLTEFLSAIAIKPNLPDMRFFTTEVTAAEYVTKLSGWVNRLNEIRHRLECSHCGQTMVSLMPYSKNLTRYNSTVFSCKTKAQEHDRGVYLSHCWACWGINKNTPFIDSREGAFKVESNEHDLRTGNIKSYYLCTFCGSGPRTSNHFTQGDNCPKCGKENMVWKGNNVENKKSVGVMSCQACNHRIHLPRKDKITGNKKNLGYFH